MHNSQLNTLKVLVSLFPEMHLSKIKQNHINVKQTESVYKYKKDHN